MGDGVNRRWFLEKYDLGVGFCTTPVNTNIVKSTQYLIHCDIFPFPDSKANHQRPRSFSNFLLSTFVGSIYY
jgi:hypothetical protein